MSPNEGVNLQLVPSKVKNRSLRSSYPGAAIELTLRSALSTQNEE